MAFFPAYRPANRALSNAAAFWFIAASLGQWAFVLYIIAFYGPRTLSGNLLALNDKPHVTGYVLGDMVGNTHFLLHVLLAAIVTAAGILQLVPSIRQRWPALHRWNGRVFMSTALIATLTGFYLVWIRGSQLGMGSNVSISLNGALILIFVALAWRSARQKDFAAHRRHALRAYLLVNGVWFLRIGIILAGLILPSFGIEISYEGGAFVIVSFASWVVPMSILELYFNAESAKQAGKKYAVAALLFTLSLATLLGGTAAAVFMWWPYL